MIDITGKDLEVRDRDIKKRLLDLQRFIKVDTNVLNSWMNEAVLQTDKDKKIDYLSSVISNLHGLNRLKTMAEELKERMLI